MKLALPSWFHGLLSTCSLLLAVVPGLALAQDVAVKPRPGTLSFVPYEVTDSNYGGMRVATLLIPAGSHSVGAIEGLLPSTYPLLATIVGSIRSDEAYQRHVQAVKAHITAQYDAAMKRGYDSIAAAGQLSRSISANNDALLSSMQSQRAAQNRADSARRTAAQAGSSGSGDGFSQYLRGTTRLADPYWGTSERDSNFSQHWTDGQGNYRASNDASFIPNAGAGGGANWQRMETR